MPKIDTQLLVEQIVLKNTNQSYKMISIDGMPFYLSSGHNSNFPNTWFPFFGCLENATNSIYKVGWLVKAYETRLPNNIYIKLRELFPSYGGDCNTGRELLLRFWNVPCLLLSSSLGGGLWDTPNGQAFKKFLEETYPDTFQQLPSLKILPTSQQCPDHLAANRWLCQKAGIENYLKLKQKFPLTVEELYTRVNACATPVAVKKVQIAELDTQNGKRLQEVRKDLEAKRKRPAPKRQDQETPLKRFQQKYPVIQQSKPNLHQKLSAYFWIPAFLLAMVTGTIMSAGFGYSIFSAVASGIFIFGAILLAQKTLEHKNKPLQNNAPEIVLNESDLKEIPIGKPSKTWLPCKDKILKPAMQGPNNCHDLKGILKTQMRY